MPTFPQIFIGGFIAIGFALLGAAYVSWSRAKVAESWPVVPGRITQSELISSTDSDGDRTWRAEIRYEYEVNGRIIEGDRVAFGYTGSSSRIYHADIQKALSAGTSVGVRVSPDDPETAALATGVNQSIMFLAIFGAIWTIFSIGMYALFAMGGQGAAALLSTIRIHGS